LPIARSDARVIKPEPEYRNALVGSIVPEPLKTFAPELPVATSVRPGPTEVVSVVKPVVEKLKPPALIVPAVPVRAHSVLVTPAEVDFEGDHTAPLDEISYVYVSASIPN
jgi:hypothetical protein